MKMRFFKIGILAAAVVPMLALLAAWYFISGDAPSAEAPIADACSTLGATTEYDSTTLISVGDVRTTVERRISGVIHHSTTHITLTNAPDWEFIEEQIYDGVGTTFTRSKLNGEWDEGGAWTANAREVTLALPYGIDASCPDLLDAKVAYTGDDTLEGVKTRKYSLDTGDLAVKFWVDDEGWLQVIETTVPSTPPITGQTTLSGRGEPNEIIIPVDIVDVDGQVDIVVK